MSLVLGPLKKKAEAKEEQRKAREAKKAADTADRAEREARQDGRRSRLQPTTEATAEAESLDHQTSGPQRPGNVCRAHQRGQTLK